MGMCREKLDEIILFWHPEAVLAEEDGYKLVLEIDAFNNHMTWNVEWYEGGYDCCKEFDNYADARDYFLEKINE